MGEAELSYREFLVGTGCHLSGQLLGHKKSVQLLTKPGPVAGGISSGLTKLLYYISWPVLTGSVSTQGGLVQSLLGMEKEKLVLGMGPSVGYKTQ